MEDKVFSGTVVWFSKGIGFMSRENDKDIFVHYSDIAQDGYKNLLKGQKVSFEIGLNHKGQDKAVNVKVLK